MHDDAPARTAVLFDIDGTLVHSSDLHVDAWTQALAAGRLRRFDLARELLVELAGRGHPVVPASSAPQGELDAPPPVLDSEDVVNAVTAGKTPTSRNPDPES